MENLLLSAEVVVPLLLLMLVGYIVRRTGLMDAAAFAMCNRLVFYVALPCLCAVSLYESDLANVEGAGGCLLFCVAGITVSFLLALLLVPRFCSAPPRRGVIAQGAVRANDAIFGLAVAGALVPQQEMQVVLLSVSVSIPLFNLCGVTALELNRGGRVGVRVFARKILTNPIIIGCAVGALLNLCGARLPGMLLSPMRSLSALCTPLAFLVIGGTLRFSAMQQDRAAIVWTTLIKLVLLPAVMLVLALLLDFSPAAVITVLAVFGAPTALSSFPLACELGGDERLAGEIVAVTSVCSIVTMFLFIFILKQLGGI